MVPILGRPVMEHILRLLARHGFDDVIANLHYFPDLIRETLRRRRRDYGVRLVYSFEPELLGTAGGRAQRARPLRRRDVPDHLGRRAHRHRPDRASGGDTGRHGGIATLALKRVDDPSQLGVVIVDDDGRIQGFQEKPAPGRGALRPRQLRHLRVRAGDLRLLPRPAVRRLGAGRLPGAARAGRGLLRPRDRRVLERRRLAARSTARATSTRSTGSGASVDDAGIRDTARRLPSDARGRGPGVHRRGLPDRGGVRLTGPVVIGERLDDRRGLGAARHDRVARHRGRPRHGADRRRRRRAPAGREAQRYASIRVRSASTPGERVGFARMARLS